MSSARAYKRPVWHISGHLCRWSHCHSDNLELSSLEAACCIDRAGADPHLKTPRTHQQPQMTVPLRSHAKKALMRRSKGGRVYAVLSQSKTHIGGWDSHAASSHKRRAAMHEVGDPNSEQTTHLLKHAFSSHPLQLSTRSGVSALPSQAQASWRR